MNKKSILLSVAIIAIIAFVFADMTSAKSGSSKHQSQEKVDLLSVASSSEDVVPLGVAIDPKSKKVVEGYAIIHHRKDKKVKPDKVGKPDKVKDAVCYEFLSKGAKWQSFEDWVVNPLNDAGLNEDFIFGNLSADISKWETASGGKDILGNGAIDYTTSVEDINSLDDKNAVYFAGIESSNTIAVTYIWGIFGGPPFMRELVEWDQIYNTDLRWSETGESDKMDFENIATHELGHSVGMGDLYSDECGEQTMYGYAREGDVNKQTLESGDIAGISSLYK